MLHLHLKLGGFHIKADVSIPSGVSRATDLLPVHHQISEAVTEAVIERETDQGKTITCQKGCSACCQRLYVETAQAEAWRLKGLIEQLPDAHRDRVNRRFDHIREQIRSAGLFDAMLSLGLYDENRKIITQAYRDIEISCPFLEEHCCSIYDDRPLACREYLVTSPAEECKTGSDIDRVRFPKATVGAVMRSSTSQKASDRLVPLALLPSWLEANPEPEPVLSALEMLTRAYSDASFGFDTHHETNDEPSDHKDDADTSGEIIPEYHLPDALMVPHYGINPVDLMEHIAVAAARHIGVILLTPDPDRTQAFIDRQPDPECFSMLVAESDTAWIQDRAPIVKRTDSGEVQWYLPRMLLDDREADTRLFDTICRKPTMASPLILARGNLVTGPDGIALSSNRILTENGGAAMRTFAFDAQRLGIKRWLLFTPFVQEMTQHADVHVRFLRDNLAAVAWNLIDAHDRNIAEEIEAQLKTAIAGIKILRIPIRNQGMHYASLLNWIQLDKHLLMPKFVITDDEDMATADTLLKAEGFETHWIDTPTVDTGGALHCLTAPVYIR